MIVFEEVTFSLTRLKTSFVSTFISWVGILVNREHSFVYSLRAFLWVVGFLFSCPFFV